MEIIIKVVKAVAVLQRKQERLKNVFKMNIATKMIKLSVALIHLLTDGPNVDAHTMQKIL